MTNTTPAREGLPELPEREELKRDIACIMAGIDKAEHPLFLARAGALIDSLGARIAALAGQPAQVGGEVGPVMGSRADAEANLLAVWNDYCATMQPAMVPTGRNAAAKRQAVRTETRNRMVNAAALLAWHINAALPPPQPENKA